MAELNSGGPVTWFGFFRRYLMVVAPLNLTWEIVQLPLYTLWRETSAGSALFATLHCTLGDIIIAALSLLGSVLILGNCRWPLQHYARVATGAVLVGLVYTGYSEWSNVYIRKSWAYSELMPVVPVLGLGLSPLLQWLIIPTIVFRYFRPH